jgi:acyl-CoA synthetase (AMP-forming)/AMP-acid ligase II
VAHLSAKGGPHHDEKVIEGRKLMSNTVYKHFREAAAENPALPFLCYPSSDNRGYCQEGVEFTYGDALLRVDALAAQYRAAAYGPGHRIALVVGNRPEHFWHLLALNSVGACVVTLNQDYLPDEMSYGIGFPDCCLVLTARPWLAKVEAVVARFAAPIPILDVESLPEEMPAPAKLRAAVTSIEQDLPALIIYTSGTTGRPKGCVISNRSCQAAAESYTSAGGLIAFNSGKDRLYIPLPAFHMNVSVYTLNSLVRMRSCMIMQDRFSASRWLSDIIATRATCFHYLGIIPPLLVKTPPSDNDKRHSARFGSGAGVDPLVRKAFEERFAVPLVEAWGMTETSRSIQNSEVPRCLEFRAFGRPRPPLEVRIVDDHDQPVPFNTQGELLVRATGPDPRMGFFSGYLNLPEDTERAWRGGWFHTGDIVRQREDGMLSFVERRKNIIRRSGENIAAVEIEEALLVLSEVKSAAALAVEHDLHDEEVMACIVLMPGISVERATCENLLHQLRGRLGVSKLPAWFAFVDHLPVTGTQKIQKGLIFPADQDPRTDPRTFDLRELKRKIRVAEVETG